MMCRPLEVAREGEGWKTGTVPSERVPERHGTAPIFWTDQAARVTNKLQSVESAQSVLKKKPGSNTDFTDSAD